ncbi:hopanoid-associated phosphorylase [Cupriavidus plantarum]|nr:hopanoid-associated phosphorylase [Cupriavidus plantarum]
MTVGDATVLAVSGMTFESRIAAGPGVTTLHGYRDRALAEVLTTALHSHRGVISIGVAGGLAPGLSPGAVIVASSVQDGDVVLPCDAAWHDALRASLPDALSGPIAGMDAAVTTVAAKAALHRAHGALAVDMESHIAARAARDRGLPFAALRIVIDPAERPVPPLAVAGMAADGSTDIGAVVRGLLKAPWELGGLIRLGRDAAAAKAALARARRMAGAALGAP